MLDFDESGFWFSNREFGFCGKTRLSTLGNPSSKWISIMKSTPGSHGFLCSLFFRVIQKGSLLGGVSMRWTVGYKTKKEIGFGFFNENPPWGQIFHYWNPFLLFIFTTKSVFRNFNSDLPIWEIFLLTITLEIVKRKWWPLFSLETFKSFLWFTLRKTYLSDVRR